MSLRSLFYFVFLSFLYSSCAVHYGTVNGTKIPAAKKGIVYKEKVYGYASCDYHFFIGGMGKQGLADQALTNLQGSVELKAGEYLDNFTTNHKKFFFIPFYMRHEVLVSADRIQSMDRFPVTYDSRYLKQTAFAMNGQMQLSCNEKVYHYKRSYYEDPIAHVVVQPGMDVSKTVTKSYYGGVQVSSFDNYNLFKRDASFSVHSFIGFGEGDRVNYQASNKSMSKNRSGEIMGSNGAYILVRNKSGAAVIHKNRVVMEANLSDNDQQLNQIMLNLLSQEERNQQVVFIDENEALSFGWIDRIDKGDVYINSKEGQLIEIPVSRVYSIRNWLVENSSRHSFRQFYKGDDLLYFADLNVEPIHVEVVGFRYYNVLVLSDRGDLIEVPIGKLFKK